MKNHPPDTSLEFSDSLNYENTVEHVLVQARKIHESVLYKAFFYLFFKLSKNEEGPVGRKQTSQILSTLIE